MDRQTFKIAKNIVATADSVEAKTDDKAIIEKIAESKFSFKAVAYEKASKAMEDEMYYDNAKELLTMIGDFKDSKELLAKCEKGLKERAVKEKALEEAIQKGKLEAEKKARETELKAQLEQLNEDLNNVPKFLGIPDKRKKAQIEEQIKIIQSEIDKLG
jgi:hypothetical protein